MRTKSFVCCALTVVSGLSISFLGLAFYYYDEDLYNRMTEKDGSEVFKPMLQADNAFVMFYSLNKHPSELDESWQRLDNIVKYNETFNSIYMGKVECSVFGPICRKFQLEIYPSIAWMQNGQIVDNYIGDNKLSSLQSFLDKKFEEHVVMHDSGTTETPYIVSVLQTEKIDEIPTINTDVTKKIDINEAKSFIDSILKPVGNVINKIVNGKKDKDQSDPTESEPLPKLPVEEPKTKSTYPTTISNENTTPQPVGTSLKPIINETKNETKGHVHSTDYETIEPQAKEKIRIVVPVPDDGHHQHNSDKKAPNAGNVKETPWIDVAHDHNHTHHPKEFENSKKQAENETKIEEKVMENKKIEILPSVNGTKLKEPIKSFEEIKNVSEMQSTTQKVSSLPPKETEHKHSLKHKDSSQREDSDEKPATKEKATKEDFMRSSEIEKIKKNEKKEVKESTKKSEEAQEEVETKNSSEEEEEISFKPKIEVASRSKSDSVEEIERNTENDSKVKSNEEEVRESSGEKPSDDKNEKEYNEASVEKSEEERDDLTTIDEDDVDYSKEDEHENIEEEKKSSFEDLPKSLKKNKKQEKVKENSSVEKETKSAENSKKNYSKKINEDKNVDSTKDKSAKNDKKKLDDDEDSKNDDDHGEIINLSELFKSPENPAGSIPRKKT